MKRKSILLLSFAVICGNSVFSQELSTSAVSKEKVIQKENSLNQAKPISANGPVQSQKNPNSSTKSKDVQVLDRKISEKPAIKSEL